MTAAYRVPNRRALTCEMAQLLPKAHSKVVTWQWRNFHMDTQTGVAAIHRYRALTEKLSAAGSARSVSQEHLLKSTRPCSDRQVPISCKVSLPDGQHWTSSAVCSEPPRTESTSKDARPEFESMLTLYLMYGAFLHSESAKSKLSQSLTRGSRKKTGRTQLDPIIFRPLYESAHISLKLVVKSFENNQFHNLDAATSGALRST